MAGPKEKAAAMNRIKAILREANFSGAAFPFSKEYGSWETDLVRGRQNRRNPGGNSIDMFPFWALLLAHFQTLFELAVQAFLGFSKIHVGTFLAFLGSFFKLIELTPISVYLTSEGNLGPGIWGKKGDSLGVFILMIRPVVPTN